MRNARRFVLLLTVLFFLAAIPWHRSPGEMPAYWLGLPDWAAVSLLCFVGVAITNAIAWLLTDLSE